MARCREREKRGGIVMVNRGVGGRKEGKIGRSRASQSGEALAWAMRFVRRRRGGETKVSQSRAAQRWLAGSLALAFRSIPPITSSSPSSPPLACHRHGTRIHIRLTTLGSSAQLPPLDDAPCPRGRLLRGRRRRRGVTSIVGRPSPTWRPLNGVSRPHSSPTAMVSRCSDRKLPLGAYHLEQSGASPPSIVLSKGAPDQKAAQDTSIQQVTRSHCQAV